MKCCRNKSKYIWGYLDKTLSNSQRVKFESHLAECAACRQELDRRKAFLHAQSALADVQVPEEFHDAWVSRLHDTEIESIAKRRVSWKMAASIAAALIVFAAGVLNFKEIFPKSYDANLEQKGSAPNILMAETAGNPSPEMNPAFAASEAAPQPSARAATGETDAQATDAATQSTRDNESTSQPAQKSTSRPKANNPGTLSIAGTEDAPSGSITISGLKYANTRDEIKRRGETLGITFSEEQGQLVAFITGDAWDPFISVLKNELGLEVTAVKGKTEKTLIVIN